MAETHAENNKFPGHLPAEWRFLERLAISLGFAAIGVAPAGLAPVGAASRFGEWIGSGFHAGMAFLTSHSHARFDTSHPCILADAKVVIAAALPYGDGAITDGFWGDVAFHARARDYHRTLKTRLKMLAGAMAKKFPTAQYRIFVDTAPLMERTWALAAGLGSLLKNGALHVANIGPKVVLGEIVASGVPSPAAAVLPPPFALCGECTRCIDACPSGALLLPAVVDCSLCLSYWTIERARQQFPEWLARRSNRIFGCDICTSVCPLGQANVASGLEPPFITRSNVPPTEVLTSLSDQALREIFSGTALLRTGVPNLLENVRWMLKNKMDGATC